jgi:hypothetical protein
LKLVANNIAETESRATERVIWSAEARAELFWRFFILFFLAVQNGGFLPRNSGAHNYAVIPASVFAQEYGQMSRFFPESFR